MLAYVRFLLSAIPSNANKTLCDVVTVGAGLCYARASHKGEIGQEGAELMQVKQVNHKWSNSLTSRKSTNRIIIHHSASHDIPASTIHQWHVNKGWSGIGYHYVIRENGDIQTGRPEHTLGAHAGAQGNPDSIGICLTGNLDQHKPTQAQMDSLTWLIRGIQGRYSNRLSVIGHKDVMATACPGRFFPWVELKARLEENDVEKWKTDIMLEAEKMGLVDLKHGHKADETATKWFVLAIAINILKKLVK